MGQRCGAAHRVWRREFIKIGRAVLFTGASPEEIGEVPEEVDAVIGKGEPLELIMRAFVPEQSSFEKIRGSR